MGSCPCWWHCAIFLGIITAGLPGRCLGQTVNTSSTIKDFVIRKGSQLLAGGQPFYITGFNNYYLSTYSAWPDPRGRMNDVNVVFRDAQKLGLNALRTWAFSDGADEWNAIQPHLGELNETILSQGLDYVIAQAAIHGIRVILTLTNYWPDYGGPPVWAQWYNTSNLVDYYQNPAIRAGIKAYMDKIVMRKNTITGRMYRDEPAILAWDIMNEPLFPGDETGRLLTAWVDDMASFIKGIDKNHLVMVGSFGYYGASTPNLLSENPSEMTIIQDQDTKLLPVAQICQGEDSSAIASLEHIDLSDMHIYPELWAFCDNRNCNFDLEGPGPYQITANLSSEGFLELCSDECRLSFMQRWIRSHLQECKRFGKPLIISEFGEYRKPMKQRNAVFKTLYDELNRAKDQGLPVAGSLFWMLEGSNHNGSEADSYAIFANSSMYTHNPQRPQPMPPAVKGKAPDPIFYNSQAYMKCASARIPVEFNAEVDINNDGWDTTLDLISQQARQGVVSTYSIQP